MSALVRSTVLAGALFLAACNATAPAPDGRGREWVAVAASVLDRRGSDADTVEDTLAFTIEGGYDVVATRFLRAGFEIGVTGSRHEVAQLAGLDDDPHMDVGRWGLGGRASLSIEPIRAVLYASGGIYYRSEDADDEPDQEQDGRGFYVGAGLDFWYDRIGRLGPFVRAYDFEDGDLNEILIGLSATFYP